MVTRRKEGKKKKKNRKGGSYIPLSAWRLVAFDLRDGEHTQTTLFWVTLPKPRILDPKHSHLQLLDLIQSGMRCLLSIFFIFSGPSR